jgi:hypothetical protein
MTFAAPSWVYVATIAGSAFLLFLVQPLIGKQVLPWFGGSAAVWSVCLVFFQTVLLAGYAYADVTTRRLAPRRQARLHIMLLLASLALLPIVAGEHFKPQGDESSPALLILALLAATVGLPYFLLSTTGPLVQAWAARGGAGPRVYRLFSLSNLASLLALLAYPFAIEPHWPLATQARAWSVGYATFVVLCAVAAWRAARLPAVPGHAAAQGDDETPLPGRGTQALWLVLPACATALLLAVTNHLTQNVASVPFLWVLPLVLYLLSFVLVFEHERWYRRALWLPLAWLVTVAGAWGLSESFGVAMRSAVPLYAALLFIACVVLHGEAVRLRPAPRHLTRFYLMLAAGGAIGGAAVGLVAPALLTGYYELGLTLVASAVALAFALRRRPVVAFAAGALALVCAGLLAREVIEDRRGVRTQSRNFYGTLQTHDRTRAADAAQHQRVLVHGSIKHGEQFLAPERRHEPTSYYGPTSGVALAIAQAAAGGSGPRRLGFIGLGAGTLATYGRAGDRLRFYEINPQVVELARTEFSFLADSAADVEIVLGDARLVLEREPPQQLHVLAVDAFSGGAIPVHLLTTQALQVYWRHMRDDGIVAIHVSNRYLDLPPVVVRTARAAGLHALLVSDPASDQPHLNRTDWVLIARDPAVLAQPALRSVATDLALSPGLRAWSDDDNDLFSVLK